MSTPHPPVHLAWLLDLTQLPTAAGREQRVIEWIRRWTAERDDLALAEDATGNLTIARRTAPADGPPLYITAHLDHPAFVVERVIGPGTVELSFRGGVMDVFFDHAPIVLHAAAGERLAATVVQQTGTRPGGIKTWLAELDGAATAPAAVGDIATWALPPAEIDGDLLHTHACDDLSAVAAALAAMDALRAQPPAMDVRLLFTRAEEVGFIGATAACKDGTIPKDVRLLALENSRAFDDSPIGGGPIVRVGDRMSIFTPWLTAACARRAEEVFNRPAQPVASQTAVQAAAAGARPARPWQRKLMAGGACEASVYCAYGYAATCLCLPLGNYHNMPHLAELQAGTYDRERLGPPRCAREFISLSDFQGLVDLLIALAAGLPPADANLAAIERMYAERRWVL